MMKIYCAGVLIMGDNAHPNVMDSTAVTPLGPQHMWPAMSVISTTILNLDFISFTTSTDHHPTPPKLVKTYRK